MAETKGQKTKLIKTPKGNKFSWTKVDPVADTYSVVVGTEEEYQNDTGTVVYQIKNATTLKSTSIIPTENRGSTFDQTLIDTYGGVTFLNRSGNQAIKNMEFARSQFIGSTSPEDLQNSGLPDLQDGTLLGNALQKASETTASVASGLKDAFTPTPVPDTQILSRKSKIGGEGALKYPIDMDTLAQDYLQISIFRYKPAKALPTINTPVDTSKNLRLEQPLEIIQIPVPNSVADQNTVDWGGGKMTSTAGELGQAVVKPLFSGDPAEANNIVSGFGAIGQAAAGTVNSAATAVLNPFIRRRFFANKVAGAISSALGINFDINQAITRLGGVVENPNLELLFTGPALRTFSFTVRFTPRRVEEAVIVRQIIRVLKERSAVKKGVKFFQGVEGGENLLLGTPDVFKLQYRKAGVDLKSVNKIKTCALTSLSVDYTGGSGRWSTYDIDSQPVTTVVQMTFSELAPIYDTDYGTNDGTSDKAFFSDDDVGF